MNYAGIDLASARTVLAAAEGHAGEIGVKAAIVVLDRGGDLVAMSRMDGAWPGAFDLAHGKASTARSFHAPSAAFVPLIQPGQPLFGINSVAGGRYAILGGGLPIQIDGDVVGAVGVSGGASDQDVAIAQRALCALNTQAKQEK